MPYRKLSEVMTHRVVTVEESLDVAAAAAKMAEKNIGSIIIHEDSRIGGILTERDILRHFGAGDIVEEARVGDWMTKEVITAPQDTTIIEAADVLVKHRFRRLPVVSGKDLVGIVTATDILFELSNPSAHGTVSDHMSTSLYTIASTASVSDAMKVMIDNNIGSVIVLDASGITGILTERDVLRSMVAKGRDPDETKVHHIMSSEVVTIDPDTEVSHACHLMYYYGCRRFPVVDNDRLVGMVSERDLLAALKDIITKG